MEYPIAINKNDYTLFQKSNPEIALIVLYVDEQSAIIHKSIQKFHVSNHYYKREKN